MTTRISILLVCWLDLVEIHWNVSFIFSSYICRNLMVEAVGGKFFTSGVAATQIFWFLEKCESIYSGILLCHSPWTWCTWCIPIILFVVITSRWHGFVQSLRFYSAVQNCRNFTDYTWVLSETLLPSTTGNFIFCCVVQVSFDVSLLLDGIVCVCASKYMVIEGLTLVRWYFSPAHTFLIHLTKCTGQLYLGGPGFCWTRGYSS